MQETEKGLRLDETKAFIQRELGFLVDKVIALIHKNDGLSKQAAIKHATEYKTLESILDFIETGK